MAQASIEFRPGVVSGGVVTDEEYRQRRDKCTSEGLEALTASAEYKAWAARKASGQHWTMGKWAQPQLFAASVVALLVLALSIGLVPRAPSNGEGPVPASVQHQVGANVQARFNGPSPTESASWNTDDELDIDFDALESLVLDHHQVEAPAPEPSAADLQATMPTALPPYAAAAVVTIAELQPTTPAALPPYDAASFLASAWLAATVLSSLFLTWSVLQLARCALRSRTGGAADVDDPQGKAGDGSRAGGVCAGDPLYGQLLVLQAELTRKKRELQASVQRGADLESANSGLARDNQHLRESAERLAQAKAKLEGELRHSTQQLEVMKSISETLDGQIEQLIGCQAATEGGSSGGSSLFSSPARAVRGGGSLRVDLTELKDKLQAVVQQRLELQAEASTLREHMEESDALLQAERAKAQDLEQRLRAANEQLVSLRDDASSMMQPLKSRFVGGGGGGGGMSPAMSPGVSGESLGQGAGQLLQARRQVSSPATAAELQSRLSELHSAHRSETEGLQLALSQVQADKQRAEEVALRLQEQLQELRHERAVLQRRADDRQLLLTQLHLQYSQLREQVTASRRSSSDDDYDEEEEGDEGDDVVTGGSGLGSPGAASSSTGAGGAASPTAASAEGNSDKENNQTVVAHVGVVLAPLGPSQALSPGGGHMAARRLSSGALGSMALTTAPGQQQQQGQQGELQQVMAELALRCKEAEAESRDARRQLDDAERKIAAMSDACLGLNRQIGELEQAFQQERNGSSSRVAALAARCSQLEAELAGAVARAEGEERMRGRLACLEAQVEQLEEELGRCLQDKQAAEARARDSEQAQFILNGLLERAQEQTAAILSEFQASPGGAALDEDFYESLGMDRESPLAGDEPGADPLASPALPSPHGVGVGGGSRPGFRHGLGAGVGGLTGSPPGSAGPASGGSVLYQNVMYDDDTASPLATPQAPSRLDVSTPQGGAPGAATPATPGSDASRLRGQLENLSRQLSVAYSAMQTMRGPGDASSPLSAQAAGGGHTHPGTPGTAADAVGFGRGQGWDGAVTPPGQGSTPRQGSPTPLGDGCEATGAGAVPQQDGNEGTTDDLASYLSYRIERVQRRLAGAASPATGKRSAPKGLWTAAASTDGSPAICAAGIPPAGGASGGGALYSKRVIDSIVERVSERLAHVEHLLTSVGDSEEQQQQFAAAGGHGHGQPPYFDYGGHGDGDASVSASARSGAGAQLQPSGVGVEGGGASRPGSSGSATGSSGGGDRLVAHELSDTHSLSTPEVLSCPPSSQVLSRVGTPPLSVASSGGGFAPETAGTAAAAAAAAAAEHITGSAAPSAAGRGSSSDHHRGVQQQRRRRQRQQPAATLSLDIPPELNPYQGLGTGRAYHSPGDRRQQQRRTRQQQQQEEAASPSPVVWNAATGVDLSPSSSAAAVGSAANGRGLAQLLPSSPPPLPRAAAAGGEIPGSVPLSPHGTRLPLAGSPPRSV